MKKYRLALFDFDGTLADTARDMANALNYLLEEESKERIPFEKLRPHVSNGTPALLRLGFGCSPGEDRFEELRLRFLGLYENYLCVHTKLFPGIRSILNRCIETGVLWGIVTNKPEYLTLRLVDQLDLADKASCVIGGDSLPQRKPHPLPITHACKLTDTTPDDCLFIGDSVRDIEAGSAAGVGTLAVTYGYIPPDDDPIAWGADFIVDTVPEISAILWDSSHRDLR